ncbi:ferric reductase like transmembrane component-domain-containing protein [Hypoxylon fragiforme]|uniref:ferric reductase like transmembrane component-domain-containing protein n=1 Tax=Hypoxylon fragiforme TaxID=63214 RepID=UPI0020C729B3|nr:ferric reductase like transmembrane component-domain-containing protein [Hypoxylon fragiforme]KAI2607205.1 ferric reductase like transmembrane component-domain-containing protein [Hypoxylon fragiforme]
MYHPTCAFACHDALSSYQLNCSTSLNHTMTGGHLGDTSMPAFITSPDCYATDDNFLSSVAYCISTHCSHESVSDIEHYWNAFLVGRIPDQPIPKESYSTALQHAVPSPVTVADPTSLLNTTTLVSEYIYTAIYNSDSYFEQMETRQNDFGLTVLITGVAIPVACSLLRFVPFPKTWQSRFNAYFIDPPMFGHKHREPFRNLALVPTRGQALLISYFVLINVVLSCVDYRLIMPNLYYGAKKDQLLVYIGNRQGVLSFANIPLLVLYAGRNNILLWITNWSHSTFLLLHRWIALICTVEACLHSAVYLQIYVALGQHSTESKLPYWIWGIVATLLLCILLPASILPLRQKLYNVFLASHFVFAFLALISCYFHIYYRYANQWGYETWLYIAFAMWGFDRVLRFARLARNGVRKAEITVIDEDYIRVDVPGIAASGNAYLYFPTLSWRVWENHPFSVMGTMMPQEQQKTSSAKPTSASSRIPSSEVEKAPAHASARASLDVDRSHDAPLTDPYFKPGLTFFLRTTTKGLTGILRGRSTLPVLVETSYTSSSLDEVRTVPNCVVIAGGVGITAVGPLLRSRTAGRLRLFWGVRSRPLVDAVRSALGAEALAPSIVGEIAIEKRLNLRAILHREVLENSETVVVVSGPVTMADEVRAIVCELGRKGRAVKLVDEAFGW